MDHKQIDAEVARQVRAWLAKTAADSLSEQLEADPQLQAALTARAERTVKDTLAKLAAAEDLPPFAHVGEWVFDYLRKVYWRDLIAADPKHRWCPWWWEHPEAVERLTPLYRRWLEVRGSAADMLAWWLAADHQMTYLLALSGPFSKCTLTKHYDGPDSEELPCEEPPEELTREWATP